MNTERLFKIVLMDLANDILKLESEIERTINSDSTIEVKTNLIKSLLSDIVTTEASITKFTGMITTKNNNDLTPRENGN